MTQQIGKRAYEPYEEHGYKVGLADQDWEKAEREIPKVIRKSIKTESKPGTKGKFESKTEAKPDAKDQ